MASIKPPYVAGMFYPEAPNELKQMVQVFLNEATSQNLEAPKAMIAPHAGYIYSGAIAGNIYATLAPLRAKIKRVILLGPAHRVPFQGLATTDVDAFQTPLGLVNVDQEAIQKALKLPQVSVFDAAFLNEHCLEVQLPFLQESLDDFQIVPFVVGEAKPHHIAEVINHLWGGEETLIVVSSDLSHYYDYETACHMDKTTSEAIVSLAPEKIGYEQACGRRPIQGLLLAAKDHQLKVQLLDLRNSGDTAGAHDRVVGYGAYHLGQ